MKEGGELDQLLAQRLGWEEAKVVRLRRTEAGRILEVPGYEVLAALGTGRSRRAGLRRVW